jgi:predicted RNase H-like nuclease (RuvC/YqgF family)
MKLKYALALLLTPALLAQTKTKTPVEVTVKTSPAETALVNASKDGSSAQSAYNVMLQQARSTLDDTQKALIKKLNDAQNDLNEKLKVDKKYKPMVDNIIALQGQLSDASKNVQSKFNDQSAPLLQKINTDKSLVNGLIPVVRQENNLPDTATYNPETQKWTETK